MLLGLLCFSSPIADDQIAMAALISRRVGLAAVRGPSRAAKKTRIVTARFVPQNHIEEVSPKQGFVR